jgi:hypothetical protein
LDNQYWHADLSNITDKYYFNTKERKNIYYEYDRQLSGGVFPIGKKSDDIKGCEFNVTQIEGEIK